MTRIDEVVARYAWLAACWLSACAHGSEVPEALEGPAFDAGVSSGGLDAAAPVASAGGFGAGGHGAAPLDGDAGAGGSAGAGLTSSVFGPPDGGTPSGDAGAVCPDSTAAVCDWTRIEGCCSRWACERASGADVFNTYPVESCRSLVECVRAHPGCSTSEDPLCFQNEDPNAPCLQQGYQASHNDPEGPFAWTAELVACVCGY